MYQDTYIASALCPVDVSFKKLLPGVLTMFSPVCLTYTVQSCIAKVPLMEWELQQLFTIQNMCIYSNLLHT